METLILCLSIINNNEHTRGKNFTTNFIQKKFRYLISIILISLLFTINWMYKNHPHQYVFLIQSMEKILTNILIWIIGAYQIITL